MSSTETAGNNSKGPDSAADAFLELREQILDGNPDAARSFAETYGPSLTRILVSKCNDDRSRTIARDIAAEVIADCCAGSTENPPLLVKYSGKGSLESWLGTVGHFRLINYWRSPRFKREVQQDDETRQLTLDAEAAENSEDTASLADESTVVSLLKEALDHAFKQVGEEDPVSLVFLRLVHVHGVQKQQLARAWNRDPAQAGRYIKRGLDRIRQVATDYIREVDPHLTLTWEDYLAVCRDYPKLMTG